MRRLLTLMLQICNMMEFISPSATLCFLSCLPVSVTQSKISKTNPLYWWGWVGGGGAAATLGSAKSLYSYLDNLSSDCRIFSPSISSLFRQGESLLYVAVFCYLLLYSC